jgi:hypothetical protein
MATAATALLALYPRRDLRGIRIVFTDPDIDRTAVLVRLDEALSLICATDDRSAKQISLRLRSIIAWPGHYSAACPPKAIQLSRIHLEASTLELASVLVHEVTHLRIEAFGVPYTESFQARIEHRCTREQASFLRKYGDEGAAMAELFEEELQRPWWTEQAHRQDIERLVGDHALPRWLGSLLSFARRHS